MFGLFNTPNVEHPQLGTLKWYRGHWRGTLSVPGKAVVPLILTGSKMGPTPEAVADALAVRTELEHWHAKIAGALFEHYEPYAEAHREGTLGTEEDTFPDIRDAADALAKAELQAIVIATMDGTLTTELCYTTSWDLEHTLGARIQRGQWLELCGSTLIP